MIEIMGKFASSMSGFWWSLDDQERRLLVLGLAWVAATIVLVPVSRAKAERERQELVDQVTERLAARG